MKKRLLLLLAFPLFLASCGQTGEKTSDKTTSAEDKNVAVALCEFSTIDSVTAQSRLVGEWELRGVQSNYMGAREDEFLTGEQIGPVKQLTFFENGEYEERVDGKLQGERQPFKLVGQSLPPVGYQFSFCGENTLVISNVAADGATDVYLRE
ncbi:MAG: hypothetical protein ACO1OQ_14095 [Rufibacter sp.]